MNALHLTPLLLVSILLNSGTYAQQNEQPGAVVMNDGSRQAGWIDYQDWDRNPDQVKFRVTKESAPVVYRVNDLRSFEIDGKDRYQRYVVSKTLAPADVSDLDTKQPLQVVTDTVFLRTVIEGDRFNLFELVDDRRYYFIQQQQTEPVELKFRLEKLDGGSFTRHTTYREQLKALTDDAELKRKIDRAEYRLNDISRIVRQLNGSVSYGQAQGGRAGAIRFLAGAGAAYNSLDIESYDAMLDNMNFDPSVSPNISVGVEIATGRNFNRLRGRFDLSAGTAAYEGEVTVQGGFVGQQERKNWKISQSNIMASFTLMYSFYRTGATEIFGAGTWSTYFTNYRENTLTTT
ncbi:MAG TPA: hypothetical protein VF145_01195, partial [Chitinophagaceae bacterium]